MINPSREETPISDNDSNRREKADGATLITMRVSHYCEKARWALDRAGMPYVEVSHAPLIHRMATKRKQGGTVPLLADGQGIFVDSTAILEHVDSVRGGDFLYPSDPSTRDDVKAVEAWLDGTLGPHTRRWAYTHLLTETKLLGKLWSEGVPPLEARLMPFIVPVARRLVRSGYRITAEGGERSLSRVQDVFTEIGERLDDGRDFLAGDGFSAADLTFASLAAPVLFPGEGGAVLPTLDQVPAPMRDEVLRQRDTTAGRFALRLYATERHRVCGGAST